MAAFSQPHSGQPHPSPRRLPWHGAGLTACCLFLSATLSAQILPPVTFSEVMYHPVEMPEFDAAGRPVLDLSADVHEFVELHCPGTNAVPLGGWRLQGTVDLVFPTNATVSGRGFLVVARDPDRIARLYGLPAESVLGPWQGQLPNDRGTLRLLNPAGEVVEEVTYSAAFPWAGSADALGAGMAWTRIDPRPHQYRGRSLERVSFTQPASDPANWLASPLAPGPSPGRTNAVSRPVPRPVIVSFNVRQDFTESPVLRAGQPVRIECQFSGTVGLGPPRVEYYVDHPDLTNETVLSIGMVAMGPGAPGRYAVVVPGQAARSVVRFRFRAVRSGNDEPVSPRADDPQAWHAFFVAPNRAGVNPACDLFLSRAATNQLHANLLDNPLRGYVPAPGTPPHGRWNHTEPAVLVVEGMVYDVQARFEGSFERRSPAEQSYRLHFPRYALLRGQAEVVLARKDPASLAAAALHRAAGIPVPATRWVDLWVNSASMVLRVETSDPAGSALGNPGAPGEPTAPPPAAGSVWRSEGLPAAVGPYGRGDASRLPAQGGFTTFQRYEWTYPMTAGTWTGHGPLQALIDGFWAARGPLNDPAIPALREFLRGNFDVDRTLTGLAVAAWSAAWDDTVRNYQLWRGTDGRWTWLPGDLDGLAGTSAGSQTTASIYRGEAEAPGSEQGPAWIKDAFFKAFREEYRQRLFVLNHTVLHPDHLQLAMFDPILAFARQRFDDVNAQLGLGEFLRPGRPVHQTPDAVVLLPPASVQASAYHHPAMPVTPHAASVWRWSPVDDTNEALVVTLVSTQHLTSVPVPFARLEYGRSYRWQVTYLDAAGHPSEASEPATMLYGTPPQVQDLIPANEATWWRMAAGGTDPGYNWRTAGFDDRSWIEAAPLFGTESAPLPEPIRTAIPAQRVTAYFRRHFDFNGNPANARLELRQLVDDGCVVYLNGVEVSRTRMPPGPVNASTLAAATVENAVWEGPIPLPVDHLLPGDNVLAVEVHQSSTNSPDLVFGLALTLTVPAVSGEVSLSEVMADNRGSVTNGTASPDWIELFNGGSTAVDLGGWSLSDRVAAPDRFMFPPRTWIAAQERLVVWCDARFDAPGWHSGFALGAAGQTLFLDRPDAAGRRMRVDTLTFGQQLPDRSISRVPGGRWQLSRPTPGLPNSPELVGSPDAVRINEWMAAPSRGPDWFELFNPGPLPVDFGGCFLSDDPLQPLRSPVPGLSFIDARGHVILVADELADVPGHVNFKLSSLGEYLTLLGPDGRQLIDGISYGPQALDVAQGRLPDGAMAIDSFPGTDSPGEANHAHLGGVVINEVLSHAVPPMEDAIELHNPGVAPVDLGGWWLSDARREPMKFRIPDDTRVAPGGHVVFYANQFNARPGSPGSFALHAARGDEVFLFESDPAGQLTGRRTSVSFGPADANVSFGRHAASDAFRFVAQERVTLGVDQPASVEVFRTGTGAPNSPPRVGPVVVSAIEYHPPDLGPVDNTNDEFVELANVSDHPVVLAPLEGAAPAWRLRDAIDFDFPPGFTLPPGGRVVIAAVDPGTNIVLAVSLADRFGLDPRVPVIGPFRGKLDNSRDSIELVRADPTSPPGSDRPEILIDRVEYADSSPWPPSPDGLGGILRRKVLTAFGNDPANWWAEEPGSRLDSDGEGLPDDWEKRHGLDPFDPADATRDDDHDGIENRMEYVAGTDPRSAASRLTLSVELDPAGRICQLEFAVAAGRTYTVWEQAVPGSGPWIRHTNVVSPAGVPVVKLPLEPVGRARFFRLSTPAAW